MNNQPSSPTITTPLLGERESSQSSLSHNSNSYPKSIVFSFIAFIALLLLIPIYIHTSSNYNNNVEQISKHSFKSKQLVGHSFHRLQSSFTRDQLCMLALGDWGRRGQFGQRLVAEALSSAVHTAKRAKPMVVSTGDNFYKSGVSSIHDTHFHESFENVYSQTYLEKVPWYVVLGNHDHLGSIMAQVNYSKQSTRWTMPHPYFEKRVHPRLHAFFLDTTPYVQGHYGRIARATTNQRGENKHDQTIWFEKQMAKVPKDVFIIVVGHHNMYSMSTSDHLGTLPVRDEFEPIILKYRTRVLAYISGHEHSLMHMQPYGQTSSEENVIDHFVSGAGSKLSDITEPTSDEIDRMYSCCGILPVTSNHTAPRTVWGSMTHGFMVFQFDEEIFTAAAIDDRGNIIYNYEKKVPTLTA